MRNKKRKKKDVERETETDRDRDGVMLVIVTRTVLRSLVYVYFTATMTAHGLFSLLSSNFRLSFGMRLCNKARMILLVKKKNNNWNTCYLSVYLSDLSIYHVRIIVKYLADFII